MLPHHVFVVVWLWFTPHAFVIMLPFPLSQTVNLQKLSIIMPADNKPVNTTEEKEYQPSKAEMQADAIENAHHERAGTKPANATPSGQSKPSSVRS